MGRRQLLTGFVAVLASGDFATFSWGPFSGVTRIKSLWYRTGDSVATHTTLGLFAANDADVPAGAYVAPFTGLPGWTPLLTPSQQAITNNDDRSALASGLGAAAGATPLILDGIDLDVAGSQFYLKAWFRNSTGGAVSVNLVLAIEENPAGADAGTVDVRPIPGVPTTPPEPPPTTPPPTPPPPPQPPPETPPPGPTLPAPVPGELPPITIDPVDPQSSVREIIAR